MRAIERLRRNYHAAFLRYLTSGEEAALAEGYRIGRSAVSDGLSILDLAQVHHDVLAGILRTSSREELDDLIAAASAFLVEVLATYEMTRRGYLAKSESP